ncbi:hypothetical protein ACJJIF_06885 [Microbulbifer sp. SSSA002]
MERTVVSISWATMLFLVVTVVLGRGELPEHAIIPALNTAAFWAVVTGPFWLMGFSTVSLIAGCIAISKGQAAKNNSIAQKYGWGLAGVAPIAFIFTTLIVAALL